MRKTTETLLLLFMMGIGGCNSDSPIHPQSTNLAVKALKEGGAVFFVRHTTRDKVATPIVPAHMDLAGECIPGSELSPKGIVEALKLKKWLEKRNISFSESYSSTTCRTLQMSKIVLPDLGETNVVTKAILHDRPKDSPISAEERPDLDIQLVELLSSIPKEGSNRAIFGHQGTLNRLLVLKDTVLKEGDALVFKASGNGRYEVISLLNVEEFLLEQP